MAEDVIVARDMLLAEYTRARYHAAHLSTLGAVRILREAKSRGIDATVTVSDRIRDLAAGLGGPEKEAYRGGMKVTIEQRVQQERARP